RNRRREAERRREIRGLPRKEFANRIERGFAVLGIDERFSILRGVLGQFRDGVRRKRERVFGKRQAAKGIEFAQDQSVPRKFRSPAEEQGAALDTGQILALAEIDAIEIERSRW